MKSVSRFLYIGAAVLILLLIVAVAFFASPEMFRSEQADTGITAENVAGDISIRRNGSNYTLKNGVELYAGDELLVGRDAACEIVAEGHVRATLDRDSDVLLREAGAGALTIEVREGAVFFDLIRQAPDRALSIVAGPAGMTPGTGAVFSLEAYPGTQTVNMYAGRAALRYAGQDREIGSGDHVTMYQSEDDSYLTVADILSSELRQFLLGELIARNGLCFDADQLRGIIADRENETQVGALARTGERMTCTVEIRCDTILSYSKERPADVPADGVILPPTPVRFTQGESAYDVLRGLSKAAGLTLEYKYLPMVNGYYVTQLGPVAAGTYGAGSGWLYKVNGWYPNYSASKHEVEDGDVIVWLFSCEGGGADLGREEWTQRDGPSA